MRNLKRALSLALASVMVLGLMVVGGGASYKDVSSDDNNVEAIEVLQKVGIMVGDENGNFNPDQDVTRNEMAVIMSNLLDYKVSAYAGTAPFSDVPEWAEPYVAACYTHEIIKGTSATTYDGSRGVTATEAALMMMKALGYFQYESDFGDSWSLAVIRQANKIDLYDDVEATVSETMTRNDVAQLVLNTLEAYMVEPDNDTTHVSTGDVVVTSGNIKYYQIVSDNKMYKAINDEYGTNMSNVTGYTKELGEDLYDGDLEKTEGSDNFGRPSTTWTYKSSEIGTYSDKADQIWTGKVAEKDLYQAAGSSAYDNYYWSVYRNGRVATNGNGDELEDVRGKDVLEYSKTSSERWQQTGNGVRTEIYVDSTAKDGDGEVIVTIIDQFVGKVTKVEENGTNDYTVTVSYKSTKPSNAETEFDTDNGEFSKDDIVVFTVGDTEIESMALAEIVEGEVTGVKTADYLELDGTTYNYNRAYTGSSGGRFGAGIYDLDDGGYADPSVDDDVILYLDTYGCVVAFEGGSANIDDYLFVTGLDYAFGDVSIKAYFADGHEETIDIDELNGEDAYYNSASDKHVPELYTIYEYSKSGNDYDLDTAKDASKFTGATIERDSAAITTSAKNYTTNNDTVFINTKDDKLWVGYKNVSSHADAAGALVTDDGIVTVVFVYNVESSTKDDDDFVYIKDTGYTTRTDSDGSKTYVFSDAYVNGEKVDFYTNSSTASDISSKGEGLYEIMNRDSDDYATKVSLLVSVTKDNKTGTYQNAGENATAYATSAKSGTLALNSTLSNMCGGSYQGNKQTSFSYDNDTLFVVAELKGSNNDTDTVHVGDVTDIETADNDADRDEYTTAVYVFVADDEYKATPYAEVVLVVKPNSDYTSTSGSGSGSGSGSTGSASGDNYSANTSMASNGRATVRLTATRPEYVTTAAALNFSFDIYVGGQYVITETGAIGSGSTTAAVNWNDAGFNGNETVEVKNFKFTDLSAQTYVLKVVDQNGNDLSAQLTKPSASAYTVTTSNTNRTFQFKTGLYNAGTFTITGIQNGTGTKPTATAYGAAANIADLKADTKGYVIVTIDTSNLTAAPVTYSIDATAVDNKAMSTFGVTDATTDTLNLAFGKTTSIANGEYVTLTAALTGSASDNYGYLVSVKVNGKTLTSTTPVTSTSTVSLGSVAITGDVNLAVSDVTITAIPKLAVVSSKWSAYEVVFTFNRDVKDDITTSEIQVTDAESGTASTVASVVVSGKTVTIGLSGEALAIGDTVKINDTVTDITYSGNTLTSSDSSLTLTAAEANKA